LVTRRSTALGAVLWVVAAVGYLTLEAVTAAGYKPSYSYTGNYISDLGLASGQAVRGETIENPRAPLMHADFYLQGILFLLGAVLIVGFPERLRERLFLSLIAANAVGNVLVGTLHSGRLHMIGAALAIVGGNAAILTWAVGGRRWYHRASELVAALGLLSLAMLMVNSATAKTNLLPDGVWERGSVYSITVWQLLTAACLLLGRGGVAVRRAA
jgi:hypothetical membrane protein